MSAPQQVDLRAFIEIERVERKKGTRVAASSSKDDNDPKGKMGFSSDGDMFFGTSASEKKSLRRTKDQRKIDPLKDLDLNAARRDAPPKIGESVRLIDLAMDDSKFKTEDGDQRTASGDPLPTLPPFKKLDRSSKARPGRSTRPFAAKAIGREFVTPEEAKQNPEPVKKGSRTRRLVVNCDFKQGQVPTRSLPKKDKGSRPNTQRPSTMRRQRPAPNSAPPPGPDGMRRPGPGRPGPGPRPTPGAPRGHNPNMSGPKRGPQTRTTTNLNNRRPQTRPNGRASGKMMRPPKPH